MRYAATFGRTSPRAQHRRHSAPLRDHVRIRRSSRSLCRSRRMSRFGRHLTAILLLSFVAIMFSGCSVGTELFSSPQNTFAPAGEVAQDQKNLFLLTMWPALGHHHPGRGRPRLHPRGASAARRAIRAPEADARQQHARDRLDHRADHPARVLHRADGRRHRRPGPHAEGCDRRSTSRACSGRGFSATRSRRRRADRWHPIGEMHIPIGRNDRHPSCTRPT